MAVAVAVAVAVLWLCCGCALSASVRCLQAYPALVRALAPYVEEAGSIVDVGCGHGMLVEAWRAGAVSLP